MTMQKHATEDFGLQRHMGSPVLSRLGSSVRGFFAGAAEGHVADAPAGRAAAYVGDSRELEVIDSSILGDRLVLVVERAGGELYSALRTFARPVNDLRRLASFHQAAGLVWDEREAESLIVVDIDVFGSMSHAIETLRRFRLARPRTTLVIASAYFARHDLSAERRVIADASVRVPSGRVGIALAIASAIENNRAAAQVV